MGTLYFKDIDSTNCYSLEAHIQEAKDDELTEITLLDAEPDNGTDEFIWCKYHGDCIERHDCKKSVCPYYESKSGRGVCKHKGKLYWHGEEVTVNVETGEVKLNEDQTCK